MQNYSELKEKIEKLKKFLIEQNYLSNMIIDDNSRKIIEEIEKIEKELDNFDEKIGENKNE